MKARCFQCVDKKATFPKENPLFCTQRCAAECGVGSMLNTEWCEKCNEWGDGGCWGCEEEGGNGDE